MSTESCTVRLSAHEDDRRDNSTEILNGYLHPVASSPFFKESGGFNDTLAKRVP